MGKDRCLCLRALKNHHERIRTLSCPVGDFAEEMDVGIGLTPKKHTSGFWCMKVTDQSGCDVA